MKLYPYQQKIFDIAIKFDSYALFMDCRTGKTPTAIEWMKAKDNGHNLSWSVECPLPIIETVWEVELAKWWQGCYVNNLRKTDDFSIPPVGPDQDLNFPVVTLVNYESFRKIEHPKFDGMVLDESQKIKDPRTGISKRIRLAGREVQYKLVLTGSPAPNTPLEYWPQMNFIDPEILGDNFYRFRNKYFYNPRQYIWVCPPANRKKIMQKIRKRAVFLSFEEVARNTVEIPPLEKIFELDIASKDIYETLKKDYIAKFNGHTVLAESELVEIMKLRQITSGFFIDSLGKVNVFSDKKIKLLDETVKEIGNNQAIIWCQFREEIRQVTRMLGLSKCSILQGGMSDKNRTRSINNFVSRNNEYMVAHPASASLGLDFSHCCYSIIYSESYSLLEDYQSKMRMKGTEKKKKDFYIYLMAKGTIDQVIYRALKRKSDLSSELLAMLKVSP